MKFLLDTHVLFWWLIDDTGLSAMARDIIADNDNTVYVSAATAWEIATKVRIGKWPEMNWLTQDFHRTLDEQGFMQLPIQSKHALKAGLFPAEHRDPFDRMLAAQCLMEEAPLISKDRALDAFDIRRIW